MFKLTETVHIGATNCSAMAITTEAEDLDAVSRQFVTAMTNAGASKEDGQRAWEQIHEVIGDRFYTNENPFTIGMGPNMLKIERIVDHKKEELE